MYKVNEHVIGPFAFNVDLKIIKNIQEEELYKNTHTNANPALYYKSLSVTYTPT